jgi:hypothetical protein
VRRQRPGGKAGTGQRDPAQIRQLAGAMLGGNGSSIAPGTIFQTFEPDEDHPRHGAAPA